MVAVSCVQIVGPARTYHDYELKAESTAKTVRSAVETARLAVSVASKHDSFPPYVSVLLSESERDAEDAAGTFAGIQPPDAHSDRIRAQLTAILDRTVPVLGHLRILARRAELERLARSARSLPSLSRQLDRFASAHG
jgi:hypothetical protein